MHQSPRKLIKCFSSYIDPTLEHDLLSPTKPWALSPLICTMPHFMHTRVPAADSYNTAITRQVGNNSRSSYLPPFPPIQSITDSTDDLYLTVIQGPVASDSSSSSSVSSGGFKPTTWSSSGIKNVVKKVAKRRSINVESDVQGFEGAGDRKSVV